MAGPVQPTTWWRRSIVVRIPADYFVRGLLLPFATLFVFGTAQLTFVLGPRSALAATVALYAGWCCVPGLLALRKRRALGILIRTEQGESLCTWCGYPRDPALADSLCPECGKPPEALSGFRARVYSICRWVPRLAAADSRSLEGELRRFVRSERFVFWPRLIVVTIAYVLIGVAFVVTLELLQDQVSRFNLRPLSFVVAVLLPLAFVGTILLLRMRRLLRWMRAWQMIDTCHKTDPL